MNSNKKIRIAKIAKELFLSGITEPLESGDKDTVEDGSVTVSLEEEGEEEI